MNNRFYLGVIVFGIALALAITFMAQDAEGLTVVNDVNGLQDMQLDLDEDYVLGQDIDATGTTGWNGGDGYIPVGNATNPFNGTFDGAGFTITGLFINNASLAQVGLFGTASVNTTITNVTLVDVNITVFNTVGAVVGLTYGNVTNSSASGTISGNVNVGGIAGKSSGGLIEYCDASVEVTAAGNTAGGLIGHNTDAGTMQYCHATGNVTGYDNVGGLVGNNAVSSTILYSHATGNVNGHNRVGGFVGYTEGVIRYCYSNGDATGPGGWYIGGFVGRAIWIAGPGVSIRNSYATGNATGDGYIGGFAGTTTNGGLNVYDCYATGNAIGGSLVGGFVGDEWDANIRRCYSTGNASGTASIGGFAGRAGFNAASLFVNCYWDVNTSGTTTAVGTPEEPGDDAGITGLTTLEMHDETSFNTWDFTVAGDGTIGNWLMAGYPHLQMEHTTHITDIIQLQLVEVDTSEDYFLENDLDSSGTSEWNWDGSRYWGFYSLGIKSGQDFGGRFFGQNHTITGFYCHRSGTSGLFGQTSQFAEIRDLTITDADINDMWYGAILVGYNDGHIFNCHVQGEVNCTDEQMGGLVGYNDANSRIENCSSDVYIHGGRAIGGLVGESLGAILNSTATGNVDNAEDSAGGLIGANWGSVENCESYVSVEAHDVYVGGLIGYAPSGTVSNSTSYGDVTNLGSGINNYRTGGFIGFLEGSTVTNCVSHGNVTADNSSSGGFIGYMNQGTAHNCSSYGWTQSSSYEVGGLIGYLVEGTVTNSTAWGNVIGANYTGGLIGRTNDLGSLFRSCAYGNVIGENYTGGLVGYNYMDMGDVYARGDVIGTNEVGGLIGNNSMYLVSSGYSSGLVTGTGTVGGLVGNNTGTILGCFWDNQTSGHTTSAGGTGKNTNEMMKQITFDAWDFITIWDIKENYTYPFFIWNWQNTPPVAVMDTNVTDENNAISVPAPGVLLNDFDIDTGQVIAIVSYTPTSTNGASVTVNADGSFSYNPTMSANLNALQVGQSTQDTFYYTISDGNDTSVGMVRITVNGVNDAPVAHDDNYTTDEDTPLVVTYPGPFGNDTDAESDTLVKYDCDYTTGYGGTAVMQADGSFVYDPTGSAIIQALKQGETLIDSFNYTVSDGHGGTSKARVYVHVAGVNDAPVAENDTYQGQEDVTLTVPMPGVLTNDSDVEGDAVTIEVVSQPANGTLTVQQDGSFEYVPYQDTNGLDKFTYRLNDGTINGNTATVWLDITPTNDAPVSANDSYSTQEDTLLQVAAPGILANDTDVDGDPLAITVTLEPAHGTLEWSQDGSFNYTPDQDYYGMDHFRYYISDLLADSGIANVSITVTSVNDPPVVTGEQGSTDEDAIMTWAAPGVLANEDDVEADTLTVTSHDPSSLGASISIGLDGGLSYDPTVSAQLQALKWGEHLNETINYTVSDGNGGFVNGTINITVYGANDTPIITSLDVDQAAEDELYSVDYDASDGDAGETLTWALSTNASSWLGINSTSGVLSGTPDNSHVGSFWVNVTVTDSDGLVDSTNFTLNVSNVAPEILTVDVGSTVEDEDYLVDYNSTDDAAGAMEWSLSTNATWLSIDEGTGVLQGTPTNDDVGWCWVNVSVLDEHGGGDGTNFTLTVINANDAPVINTTDVTYVVERMTYSVHYDAIDVDSDDELEWNLTTNASWLSLNQTSLNLSGFAGHDVLGSYWVNVSVRDLSQASDFTNFTLEVLVDTDSDGTPDRDDSDDDGDGTPDSEDAFRLDPSEDTDTDGDGTGDNADEDDDGDGMSDEDELDAGLDPLDPSDGGDTDSDGDGISNYDEITLYHTDPLLLDSDGDGTSDKDEIDAGTDPLDPASNISGKGGDNKALIIIIAALVLVVITVVLVLFKMRGPGQAMREEGTAPEPEGQGDEMPTDGDVGAEEPPLVGEQLVEGQEQEETEVQDIEPDELEGAEEELRFG